MQENPTAFPTRMLQEDLAGRFHAGRSSQEDLVGRSCGTTSSHKIFLQDLVGRFSHKISRRIFPQDFPQDCPTRFPSRLWDKILWEDSCGTRFPTRLWDNHCPARFSHKILSGRSSRKFFLEDLARKIVVGRFPAGFVHKISHIDYPPRFPARFLARR